MFVLCKEVRGAAPSAAATCSSIAKASLCDHEGRAVMLQSCVVRTVSGVYRGGNPVLLLLIAFSTVLVVIGVVHAGAGYGRLLGVGVTVEAWARSN